MHSSLLGVRDRPQSLPSHEGLPCRLPRLLMSGTHFVQVSCFQERQSLLIPDPARCAHPQAHPRRAFPTHWVVTRSARAGYQSHDNTKEAGKGWGIALDLSSTEGPAVRSETQQPSLFVICMADVSYLWHQEIMPIDAQ